MEKTELIGLSKDELAAEVAKIGEKPFRDGKKRSTCKSDQSVF